MLSINIFQDKHQCMLGNIDNNLQGRYARAIYLAAKKKESIDLIQDELLDLQQKFSADNRLVQFLRNPVVNRRDKADFIRQMFGASISDIAERTISLLCKNNRLE